jgi:hypothetical protein
MKEIPVLKKRSDGGPITDFVCSDCGMVFRPYPAEQNKSINPDFAAHIRDVHASESKPVNP